MQRSDVIWRNARLLRWIRWGWRIAAFLAPSAVGAQLAPDTPRLLSPHGSGGLAVHFLRAGTLPGDGDALLATWTMPRLPDGLRFRGGAGRGATGTDAMFGGVDFQSPLLRATRDLPIDLDWQTGAGLSVGDYILLTVPVGLTGGVSWTSGAVWFAPYLTAGIAADLPIGDSAPDRGFDVSPSLDIGFNLSLDIERRFVLRTAASLGDRQAVSVGLAFGLGRLAREP
jgi:hypothetical protein